MAETAGWLNTGGIAGNEVLHAEGFYLSYATGHAMSVLSMFGSDNHSDETALVVDGEFYILNGDFRREYETLVPKGVDACMAFFNQHKSQASSWSEHDAEASA